MYIKVGNLKKSGKLVSLNLIYFFIKWATLNTIFQIEEQIED